jgi:hypothetical protein
MDWLARHGFEAVTLDLVQDAWYRDGTLPRKPVVISFDDGYRPQFTFALPTLREHGWAGRPQPQGGKARTSTAATSKRCSPPAGSLPRTRSTTPTWPCSTRPA